MKTNLSRFKSAIACMLLLLMMVMLSSCSFNKDDAELSVSHIKFQYYEETNITLVRCDISVANHTIYDINSIDLVMGVYSNGKCISSESRHYDIQIHHRTTEYATFSFTVEGEANYAALQTWTPNYEPFWMVIFNILER